MKLHMLHYCQAALRDGAAGGPVQGGGDLVRDGDRMSAHRARQDGNVVLTGLADAIVVRFQDAAPVMVGVDPVISFGAGERIRKR
jgi:hypothetical protein